MKHVFALTIGLALAASSIDAFAGEGSAAFIRGEVGNSNLKIDGTDGNDTVFSVRGGYYFNGYVGMEAFYSNLGKDSDAGATVEANSYGIGIVAKKNFSDTAHTGGFITGRVGVARTTVDVDVTGFFNVEDTATQPYIGIGGGYDVSENFGVSVAIDYQDADVFDSNFKFTTTSVALEYRF